jgi:molecular chaperone Hsp33
LDFMPDTRPSEPNGTVVTIEFIRHRNVLMAKADLSPLFVDYYLHLADQGIKHAPEHDRLLRDALAAFALHCASRPKNEHIAWTMNFQDPRLNLFLTGDNEDCFITGRLFTENVRELADNVFYSEVMPRRGAEKRRSVVNFEGANVFAAVEAYYNASEQRPARYFHLGEDNFAMLVSHPDCDLNWLASVGVDEVKAVGEKETLAMIERRLYQWHCGCDQKKILAALAPAARHDMAELFGNSESIRVECPRCAASHLITREAMEAFLQQA